MKVDLEGLVSYVSENRVDEILLVDRSNETVTLQYLRENFPKDRFVILNVNQGKLWLLKDRSEVNLRKASKRKVIYLSPMMSEHDRGWKTRQVIKLLEGGLEVMLIFNPRYKLKQMYHKHGQSKVTEERQSIIDNFREQLGQTYPVQESKQGLLVKPKAERS